MNSCEDEKCGWVVKLPYTTNGHAIRYPQNINSIVRVLNWFQKEYKGTIKYAMLQPCMSSKREYKMVVTNGTVLYEAKIGSYSKNRVKGFPCKDDRINFANEVFQKFQMNCPRAITDGLLRIDIFCTASGKLVVNELESLDAAYYSTNYGLEITTTSFLIQYWREKILLLVSKFVNYY